MTYRNFLPQDTRVVELASAYGLLLLSVSAVLGGAVTPHMAALHPPVFWGLIAGSLGGLQLVSLAGYPLLEPLRCWMALVCGSLWVWLCLHGQIGPTDIGALTMGLTNLYGFTVGFLFLKKSWLN